MEGRNFTSPEAELQYWKDQASEYKNRYEEAKEELDEFQLSSQELEAELEAALEQAEHKIKDLSTTRGRLDMECDTLREKLEILQNSSHKQITELEDNLAKMTGHKNELVRYIRELEQSNDDLERAKRATVTSLEDFETRLNLTIERNAFLESELDDKESMSITVQRLKDEARDLRQELAVRHTPEDGSPVKLKADIAKMDSPATTPVVDSNKLVEEMEQTQTVEQTPVKPTLLNHTAGGTPFTPSSRISALNIVGDLLRKVGALENKLASCRNFVNQPPRSSKGSTNSPMNSPRAKRLHRGSGSLQSDPSTTPRSTATNQQGYVNVKITI